MARTYERPGDFALGCLDDGCGCLVWGPILFFGVGGGLYLFTQYWQIALPLTLVLGTVLGVFYYHQREERIETWKVEHSTGEDELPATCPRCQASITAVSTATWSMYCSGCRTNGWVTRYRADGKFVYEFRRSGKAGKGEQGDPNSAFIPADENRAPLSRFLRLKTMSEAHCSWCNRELGVSPTTGEPGGDRVYRLHCPSCGYRGAEMRSVLVNGTRWQNT